MNEEVNRSDILVRLHDAYPYADERFITEKANRLCCCNSALRPNIHEWLSGKSFSDAYIHGKYTIKMILSMRGYDGTGAEFVDAFLALDDYATDENAETGLWRIRL